MDIVPNDVNARLYKYNSVREMKAFSSYLIYHGVKLVKTKNNIIRGRFDGDQITIKIKDNDINGDWFLHNLISDVYAFTDHSKNEFDNFIGSMISDKDNYIFPESELKWLKENEVACYWFWMILKKGMFLANNRPEDYNLLLNGLVKSFDTLEYESYPLNSKSLYNIILDCIDSWYSHKDKKIYLMQMIKAQWIETKKIDRLRWVKKENPDQCIWLWSYMSQYEGMNQLHSLNVVPLLNNEIYLVINAFYYFWHATSDTKKVFYMLAQKAWHQKKYRDQQQKRKMKAINTHISEKCKDRMDYVLRVRNIKMNELIETLIDKEFDLLISKNIPVNIEST